jgi:hypothetical protein
MAVTIDNIIVGAGNLFISDKTVALETLSTSARDVYHVGATMEGVEVAYEPDYTDIVVDQLKDAAIIYQNGYRVTVRTNLAEGTLANLKVAWGKADADLTNPSGSTQRLNMPIAPDEPKERKLLVIGRNSTDLERKYFGRRAIAVDTSSHALRRGEATMFPVAFRLLADPSYSGAEYGYIEDTIS